MTSTLKPTPEAERESGYYWVQIGDGTVPGKYDARARFWLIFGWPGIYHDRHLVEIGPRIEEPPQ